jgi:hypothetical protein
MASYDSDIHEPHYSCKCLNVRIRAAAPHGSPPQVATDSEYNQVYAGEEGITVVSECGSCWISECSITFLQAHPQLTLRIRARGVPITGTPRCSRYTSLTCLICQVLVYRVHQVVPLDIEGKDGPLLPTEDWVEEEIMKSSNGWIETHIQCLVSFFSQRLVLPPRFHSMNPTCSSFLVLPYIVY